MAPDSPETLQPAQMSLGALTISPAFTKISAALLRAQVKMAAVRKSGINENFDSAYPTLEDVLDVVKPALNEESILLLQPTTSNGGRVRVTTLLLLGEEYMACNTEMTARDASPHGLASTITYAQRYALKSLFVLGGADDDANAGMRAQPKGTPRTQPAEPPQEPHGHTPEPPQGFYEDAPPAASAPDSPLTAPAQTERPAQAPEAHEAPALPGAPESLSSGEIAQILRLSQAMANGECSLERARVSLSEGGTSYNRLSPEGRVFARRYILGEEVSSSAHPLDAELGV